MQSGVINVKKMFPLSFILEHTLLACLTCICMVVLMRFAHFTVYRNRPGL